LAKTQLMNKVARFQAEGGSVQRMPGLYGDIVNATLTFPDVWGEAAGLEPDVILKLDCLPDFYGDEIALDQITASDLPPLNDGSGSGLGMSHTYVYAFYAALKRNGVTAFIKGDYPGRMRIGITNNEFNYDWHSVLWGLRSRYYVDPRDGSRVTAQLAYNTGQLTAVNGATQTLTGAPSTTFPLPVGGTWITGLTTYINELLADMTHVGTYRVWLCVNSDNVPQVRLGWVVGSQVVPIYNDAVTVPVDHQYCLLDLGEIRIDPSPMGPQTWKGLIQAYSALPNGGDNLYLQDLYLQPLDDGGGRLIYNSAVAPSSIGSTKPAGTGADSSAVGTMPWTNPGNILALDNVPAGVLFSAAGQISHNLVATGFGFGIPAGATIKGIMAQYTCRTDRVGGIFDNGVVMATNGNHTADPPSGGVASPGSPATVSWATGFVTRTYGDPTNLWGAAWTPALINAAGFGLQISCKPGSVGVTFPVNAFVDYVAITVYYTIGSGPALAADAVVYYTGYAELRTEGMYRLGSPLGSPPSNQPAEISRVIGDLPRIPPSGMEGRPCEIFIKPSTGDLGAERDAMAGFTSTPQFVIKPYYRPSYLFPP
jgi:hypothetical protein